jgi:hypothetical protein
MSALKPHQQDLLARIVRSGGLATSELDGRLLRPLKAAGLVELNGNRVVPTSAGRAHIRKAAAPPPERARLNPRQEDLLRTILRRRHMPAEELDGRVSRPLIARGLVTVSDDDIASATSAGRVYFEQSPTRARRRRNGVTENARATAIRRAVARLESAIPPGSEVLAGNIMASAEDVLDAFLRHARRLERPS